MSEDASLSKIIFSEKSLSVHMSVLLSVCPSVRLSVPSRPRPCPPKKSLKLKTLLRKVIRYTIRVTKIHPESCCRCRRHCCRCCMLLLHAAAAASAAAAYTAATSAAATKTTAFLGKAKPSYLYSTQFRVTSPLQSWSKAVFFVLAHLGGTCTVDTS